MERHSILAETLAFFAGMLCFVVGCGFDSSDQMPAPTKLQTLEERFRQSPSLENAFQLADAYRGRIFIGGAIPKTAESLEGMAGMMEDAGIELSDEIRGDIQRNVHQGKELTAEYGVDNKSLQVEAAKGEALMKSLLKRPDLSPADQSSAHLFLGYFLLAQNHLDDARQSADQAKQLEPNSPFPHRLAGKVLEAQGQYEQAITEHQTAAMKADTWASLEPTLSQTLVWDFTSPTTASAASRRRNWKEHKHRVAQAIRDGASMDIDMCKLSTKMQKMD